MILSQAVDVYGPDDAPPLVLVHGVRLGRHSWDPHVALLRKEFRVIVVDLPRHGALTGVPFTLENVMRVMNYACCEVPARPPLLAGYSLGGFVAMLFAAVRPQAIASMALFGATVDLTSWRDHIYRASVDIACAIPAQAAEAWSRFFFHALLPREYAETIIHSPFDYRAFCEGRDVFSGVAFSELLARYPGDVLVVNGQYDFAFRHRARFERGPRVRTQIVPGVDHVFPLRHVRAVCDILQRFATQEQGSAAM